MWLWSILGDASAGESTSGLVRFLPSMTSRSDHGILHNFQLFIPRLWDDSRPGFSHWVGLKGFTLRVWYRLFKAAFFSPTLSAAKEQGPPAHVTKEASLAKGAEEGGGKVCLGIDCDK